MKKPSIPYFFTVKDIAESLGVSSKTVRRRIAAGEIRCHRIGRQVRVSDEDLRAYVALQRQ